MRITLSAIALVGMSVIGLNTVNALGWSGNLTSTPARVTSAIKGATHTALKGKAPTTTKATVHIITAPPPVTRPNFDSLSSQVNSLVAASGDQVGVNLIELGGSQPGSWSSQPDQSFTAASTYKLPLLMEEAQLITSGRALASASDSICYESDDWEDGWFSDYTDGACYTRGELDQRVAHYSDNTAAHMLVRTDGGSDALNAYAAQLGAHESTFFQPNLTTASDLARLWQSEATGQAGGAAAQAYLYPLLTGTEFESGIPAGVPSGTQVVHKVGFIDGVDNDAALVNAPHGAYILTICTNGQGGDSGWQLAASISRVVSSYENAR